MAKGPTLTLAQQLAAYRCERDWTHAELAEEMAKLGLHITSRQLANILHVPERTLSERSQWKIERYLQHVRRTDRKRFDLAVSFVAQRLTA